MVDLSLKEFIEAKLSINGFAMEEVSGGILIWPRGMAPETAKAVIEQQGEKFVATKGEGGYARKQTLAALNIYLKQWAEMYKMGAR
jgi:hypothetical protein